jgi:serine/threonine-protein kinase
MIGRTIGKYRIIGQLGRGGMGTVYRAIDDTLEREVAIKVLNPELADSQVIKRFRQEAITLAKLSHPEIATIYELLRSDADLLMVMELVRGETLDSICRRMAPLPPEHVVYLADRILSGLGHAHSAGIVHCDMKPANVMVTGHGLVKIMDFGIARVRGADHATPNAQMIGTPAYMPPEQALGQEVDARSDLYSVGIILYRLLTGAVPFNAPSAIGLVQQQVSEIPAPLHVHREGLPDWCEPILQRALAKSQADRFQTADEFRETLQTAAGYPTPEAARAFFGSSVDLSATETPRPGVLERLGLTRAGFTRIWSPATTPIGQPLGPAAGGTVVLPRRRTAAAMLLVVLTGAVAVSGLVGWWRRAAASQSAATANPVSRSAGDAAAPAVAVSTTSTSGPEAPSRPAASPAPAASGTEVPRATPVAVPPTMPALTTPAMSALVPPAPPILASRANVPPALPYVFDAIALVNGTDHPRERAAQVFLIDGMLNVKATDDNSLLYALPLDSVLSITYSDGRDPLWKGPEGPTPVARGPMGLGIFRGPRHWVSLHTQDPHRRFVVLRLGSGDRAKSAIAALEQRTGQATVMLAEDLK